MAHFLAVLDPDPDRGRRVAAAARAELAGEPGVRVDQIACGELTVVWAANPGAPVDAVSSPGSGAVVLGEPLGAGGRPADAAAILRQWGGGPERSEPHDGFFVAIGRTPEAPLLVEGDLLGLFPIYHCAAGDVVLASTSPTLLRLHPRVRPELDPEGLLGILLTGGPVRGRTVWSGIQRLAPGHLLVSAHRGRVRELHQYTPPRTTDLHTVPYRAQLEALDEALRGAVARQSRRRAAVLLLSGGRDSRLLGGVLRREGSALRALTLGRTGDDEAYCARRVARALGAPHRLEDVPPATYVDHARRWADWEHMVGNVSGLYTWRYAQLLEQYEERWVANGVLLELAAGGVHGGWGTADGSDVLGGTARRSIPAGRLRTLVRPALRDAVDTTWEAVRLDYRDGAEEEEGRTQRFLYRHWGRFHSGSVPWRTAFGAWPLLPILDREVLAVGGSLPLSTVQGRRGQDELLRTRYRSVARAPLERHTPDLTPLLPGPVHRSWAGASRRLPFLKRWAPERRVESYVHRIYDADGDGWRAVRRRAEPFRERLLDVFEPEALRRFLPPPPDEIETTDPVVDGFGPRQLVGLMLWAGRHRT